MRPCGLHRRDTVFHCSNGPANCGVNMTDFPKEPISDERVYELIANVVDQLEGIPISQAEHVLKQAAFYIKAGSNVVVDPRLRGLTGKSEV